MFVISSLYLRRKFSGLMSLKRYRGSYLWDILFWWRYIRAEKLWRMMCAASLSVRFFFWRM